MLRGNHHSTKRRAKAKDFRKALKDLFSFLKPFRVLLIVALVFSLSAAALQIFFPILIGNITAHIAAIFPNPITGELSTAVLDTNYILNLALITGILSASAILLNFWQGFIMTSVTQWSIEKMRSQIIKKINNVPLKFFDTTSTGDILARLTSDVDLVGQWLSHLVITLVTSTAMLIGLGIMMFIVNWIMALAAIGSILLGAVSVVFIMKKSQKFHRTTQAKTGELNGQIEETYSSHSIVKAYSAGDKLKWRFDKTNNQLKKANGKATFLSIAMHPIMHFVGNLSFVVVCVVGAVLIINGHLEGAAGFGVIASFLIFVQLFSQPLMQLAEAAQGIQITVAASERIFEFLHQEELENEEQKRGQGDAKQCSHLVHAGEVEFRDVVFGYEQNKPIIKGFSVKVAAGSTVAIVGPTGGGKTTLVNLLMRFYELDSGSILIDGVDIAEKRREEVADLFGMVLQDTWIFEGTIAENIAYNSAECRVQSAECRIDVAADGVKRHSSDNQTQLIKNNNSELENAATLANLNHYIKTLPNGYDTILNEKSALSAGQRQLITIARAFMANKPMLILDEATSSVDTRTEILIQEATERLTAGRTTFVIAHRLSTIKNADLILVLKDGDIIEKGNHKELLAQNGFYAELYNAQFSN